jgi:hypothetical protein
MLCMCLRVFWGVRRAKGKSMHSKRYGLFGLTSYSLLAVNNQAINLRQKLHTDEDAGTTRENAGTTGEDAGTTGGACWPCRIAPREDRGAMLRAAGNKSKTLDFYRDVHKM